VRKSLSPAAQGASPRPPPGDQQASPPKQRSVSLSLSPSPDRKELSPLRVVSRREGFDERKWQRSEQKRRRSRPEEEDAPAAKQKRRAKEKKKKKKKRSEDSVLEARRKKFESKAPVDVGAKKIQLRGSPAKADDKEAKAEKPQPAKAANPFDEYVDESILDTEFGDWYSSDEEVEQEQKAGSVSSKEEAEETQTVSFTCTLNPSPSESEKENSAHGGTALSSP